MQVFPELYTKRLIIRKITIEDIPALLKYANNKKISDRVLNIPHPYREPEAVFRISYVHQGFKNKTRYVFAIILKESQELIGEIGLHMVNPGVAQLAYWVGEPYWGQGLATEATEAAIKFGMETLHLDMLFAECHVDNIASEKVLVKTGTKKVGVHGNVVQYKINFEIK